jgi:hypothetical protein
MTAAASGDRVRPFLRRNAADLALALLLALAAAGFAHHVSPRISDDLLFKKRGRDILFDSDPNRVYDIETNREGRHVRSSIHPVYSLLNYPPVFVLRKAGIESRAATRVYHAGLAGLFTALFFLVLRRTGIRRTDALVFTGVLGTSMSALLFFPLTETFVGGAMSMLPAVVLATTEAAPWWAAPAALWSGMVLTLTNGIAAVAAAAAERPFVRFLRDLLIAFGALLLLSAAQQLVFPTARPPLIAGFDEASWIFSAEAGGAAPVTRALFFHSMVAPELSFMPNWREREWPLLSFQMSPLGSGSRWAPAATLVWAALLAFGLVALLVRRDQKRLRVTLGVTLLYQWLLHLVYGRETILYALHVLPFLVIAAALVTRTRYRPLALTLAALLIPLNVLNNAPTLDWALRYAGRYQAIDATQKKTGRGRMPHPSADPAHQWRIWSVIRTHGAPPEPPLTTASKE